MGAARCSGIWSGYFPDESGVSVREEIPGQTQKTLGGERLGVPLREQEAVEEVEGFNIHGEKHKWWCMTEDMHSDCFYLKLWNMKTEGTSRAPNPVWHHSITTLPAGVHRDGGAAPKSAAVTQEGQRSSREEVRELTDRQRDRQRAVMCVFVCQRSAKWWEKQRKVFLFAGTQRVPVLSSRFLDWE